MRFILCLALVAGALAHSLTDCTRNGHNHDSQGIGKRFPWIGEYDEDKNSRYPNPGVCTTWDHPYCIKSNEHSVSYNRTEMGTWKYACAQCRHSCDCPIGKYCQLGYSEAADFGTCVSYKSKIGTPCDADLMSGVNYPTGDTKGAVQQWYGEQMVCALYVKFDYPHYNFTQHASVWSGACVNGYCRECNSYMIQRPGHHVNDRMFFTESAQTTSSSRTLQCMWGGNSQVFSSDAPYKYKPKVCRSNKWSSTSGVSIAAPAAALLIAAVAF